MNEKYEEFTARYGSAGVRVVRCSGDTTDGIGPVLTGRYDLAFFTYETFLNLALGSARLLTQLGLVVVDEGQFITDLHRGITVELIFALLLRALHGPSPNSITSAVCGLCGELSDPSFATTLPPSPEKSFALMRSPKSSSAVGHNSEHTSFLNAAL